MKLLAGSILILVFLDGYHSAPLTNYGDKNGHYKEGHTAKRWGKRLGFDLNLGLEAGVKNGVAHLQTKNHVGVNVGGSDEDSSKELEYPIYPTPKPFGSAFDYPYYPTHVSPYDMYGSPQLPPPYFSPYPVEYSPQYPFYRPYQYPPRYDTQYQSWPPNRSQSINEEGLQ